VPPRTFAAILFSLLSITAPTRAATIYATNDGGPWLGGGGPSIDDSQYFGVDFTITSTSQVTGIGGSIIVDLRNVGSIFGAILPLVGSTPFPNSPSELEASALAGLTLIPTSTPDAFASLSLTLEPGNYALVFGGGTQANPGPFGANGRAAAVGLEDTNMSAPVYIASIGGVWAGGTPGNVIDCHGAASNCVLFSVFGDGAGQDFSPGVPEPSTWAMTLLGFVGLGYAGYRASRGTAALA
jgi:hypothetical protein